MARLSLYRASENVPSRLTLLQKLLIRYLTSSLNATPHCASLARNQLSAVPGGAVLLEALDADDYAALDAPDEALARYVSKLTLHPGDIVLADIDALRACGFDDLDILDANNQCAHLNYTNRIANGLGLLTEAAVAERSRDRIPPYRFPRPGPSGEQIRPPMRSRGLPRSAARRAEWAAAVRRAA